jgi:hypothetical protein
MKRIYFKFKLLKLKRLSAVALVAVTMLGLGSMALQPKAAAVSLGGPYNCDANAVLVGGASNTDTVISDYKNGITRVCNGKKITNSAASIHHIYSRFGISNSEIQGLSTTAVAGAVTKSGNVYANGHLVATGALTAGRQFISRSTRRTVDGTTFYTRPPSVSFLNNSLSAYVVMQDGQFKFAILSSCGNPVTAHPKPPVHGELACTELLATPGTIESNGDQSYTFTARAKASNASISKYVFDLGNGHGTQTVKTSATSAKSGKQTYAPGSYTVKVTVSGVAQNAFTTAPSPVSCTKQFTVKQNGTLTCNGLTLNEVGTTDTTTGNVTYTLTAQATATKAAITKYVFDFGNGSTTQTINTSANSATSRSAVYAAGQTYPSIFVTVFGTSKNSGKTLSAGGANSSCATNLTVPPQTCSTGSQSSACKPTCTAPNGQTFPAGSSQCLPVSPTPPTTPASTVLPNTGAGNVLGLFAGVSLVGGLGYRFLLSHRLSRNI